MHDALLSVFDDPLGIHRTQTSKAVIPWQQHAGRRKAVPLRVRGFPHNLWVEIVHRSSERATFNRTATIALTVRTDEKQWMVQTSGPLGGLARADIQSHQVFNIGNHAMFEKNLRAIH